MTRRILRWLCGILLVLLGLPIIVIGIILIVANTGPGRRLIENQTASLSGGIVRIDGLSGRFPDALRAERIRVSDAAGAYVTIDGLILDWSPTRLVRRTAQVDRLHADRLRFDRLPKSETPSTTTSSSSGSFNLPVQVDLRDLRIDQTEIGPEVAGAAATLGLDGSAQLQTLSQGTLRLQAHRLDSPGDYAITGTVTAHEIHATVKASEPRNGMISAIAHLPDLGAIAIQGEVNGPTDSLGTRVGIEAGELTASASGTVDLDHQAADLAVKANAPAMTPAAGVSWQSVRVDAAIHGPFARPDANGTMNIAALNAGGARIGALAVDVKGNAGQVRLHATVQDLHVPGPQPDLFAAAPVIIDVAAQLDAAGRPVTFALHHPLVSTEGTARTDGAREVQVHVLLPDLAPLAAAGGTAIDGSADLNIQAAMDDGAPKAPVAPQAPAAQAQAPAPQAPVAQAPVAQAPVAQAPVAQAPVAHISVQGRIAITGGIAPVPALIGDNGRIDLAVSMHGQDITLSRLQVNGKALDVSANGGMTVDKIDLDWAVALTDLAAIQADLSGRAEAKGHAGGKLDDLTVHADIAADLAAKGYNSGRITAKLDASNLPAAPHAEISADGTLLDSPLELALIADKSDSAMKVNISQAAWKSLAAGGDLSLATNAIIPTGKLRLDMGRLADLQPLLGRALAGQANATLDSDDQAAHLSVAIRDVVVPGTASVAKAALTATVSDPAGTPSVDGTFTADGISAAAAKSASARVTAKGPLDALGITIAADSPAVAGGPAKLTAAGTLNVKDRTFGLAKLEAGWKQQVLRLLQPAKFSFADGVAMDRLRLGLRQAELSIAGSAGSKLDLTATLRNLPADIAAVADASLAADGVIAADARLTGTSARPEGTVKLTAERLHLRQGAGQSLPPANLTANVALLGTAARVDTRLTAGPSNISVTGTAPITSGAMDLKTVGRFDLAMLDPLLSAQGRRARGDVTLDANITGTSAAPLVRGTAELHNGDVTDYTLGAHVSDLAATLQAAGDTIRLSQFSGKAGPGTVGGGGTISLAGTMPVNLRFTADNARPLSSDLITALIDANLTVQGDVKGDLQAGGTLHVRRADIRIPDKLPLSIAVLPVRNANAPPPPPETSPQGSIALALTLDAPQQVFIRGRGLDAELGGTIHINGTSAMPIPDGGLQLRRGTLSVIGTTLNFTEGTIDFNGAGIADPALHFVASSSTSTIIATVTVSGNAKDPKITLSSVPDLPQDEILAQLLFNTSTSKLSALQLAQIAAALASLSGATSGADPLEKLRNAFGLDRLSVGSSSTGSPTLEAGRYVARGVYLGAKQSASGSGTQATVQIDIAKGLKLETTAGSGSSSATGSTSSGDAASVGFTYRFEY